MKFSPAVLFAILGINLTALAQAEVAQPKNDLTEHFQVAQPKIKNAPVPEQTEKSQKKN